MMTSADPVIPVAGRTCGDCAMCCKLPHIPELEKLPNVWCTHCVDNKACGIYETRPQRCRDFFCQFMLGTLGEEWRPNKCRFVIAASENNLVVYVDPARPDNWRKEPFISNLQRWSAQYFVTALVGPNSYAIFPDHIDALGEVTDEYQVMYIDEPTPNGVRRRAERVLRSEVPPHMQTGISYKVGAQ